MFRSPIHHTFGPLATQSQILKAISLQLTPWKWKKGKHNDQLKSVLKRAFSMDAHLFFSGREALLAILQSMELRPGEEIILQAYTCIVVPNAIKAAGGKPVYCDIEKKSLNIDTEKISDLITPRTRAIICQHTFGIPADLQALRNICDKHKIALIEDCAHTIATADDAAPIGEYGDFVFLSFGRDKALSGVTGGAALSRHSMLSQRLADKESHAKEVSTYTAYNLVSYPLRYTFAKFLWPIGLGKIYLKLLQIVRQLPPIVEPHEKEGYMSQVLRKLPNGCASLALRQWHALRTMNAHRRQLSIYYAKQEKINHWKAADASHRATALQKFPIFVENAEQVRLKLKDKDIHLEDGWSFGVINPKGTNAGKSDYIYGSCPVAENVAKEILSLPTHPTMSLQQAKRLVVELQKQLINAS